RAARAAAPFGQQEIEPLIEVCDGVGDTLRDVPVAGLDSGLAVAMSDQPRDLPAEIVEARVDRGEVLAATARHALMERCVLFLTDAIGQVEDDGVEPLADRHAGTAGGLADRLPCLRVDALDVPRRRSHSSIRIAVRAEANPRGSERIFEGPWIPPARGVPM